MKRVLVTRPEPDAARTAERLTEGGWQPLVLPLTEIVALPMARDALSGVDAVAVTSANALRRPAETIPAVPAGTRIFAVGAHTARTVAAAGLGKAVTGPGDGAGLARLIAGEMPKGSRVGYLCGRVRSPDLERALAAAGHAVVAVEAYDARERRPDAAALAAIFGGGPVDAVLVHSAQAARHVAALARRAEAAAALRQAAFVCISARVAAVLAGDFGGRVHAAGEPDEDALLAALAAHVPPAGA